MSDMGIESFDADDLWEVMRNERNVDLDPSVSGRSSYLGDKSITPQEWYSAIEAMYENAEVKPFKMWDVDQKKYVNADISDYGINNGMTGLATLAHKLMVEGEKGLSDKELDLVHDAETSVEDVPGITIIMSLSFLFGSADSVSCVKNADITVTFRFSPKKKDSKNKTLKAFLSEVPVAMIPVDKFGRTGFYNKLGDLKDIVEGGKENPRNMVAATRDENFNVNTAKVEAGTFQNVFILLDDCPAPELPNTDIDGLDTLDQTDISSNVDDPNYQGAFTAVEGIPLSMFDSNPNTYGPLLKKDSKGSIKKHREVLVNRGFRSFVKGHRVVCSKIDGEWLLPIDADNQGASTTPFKVGKWGPTMYMTSTTDGYFKDSDSEPWSTNHYELSFRYTFYSHQRDDLNKGAELEFKPSDNYWQYTSFDMMDSTYGGISEATILGSSNPHYDAAGFPRDPESLDFWHTLPFSGLLLTDGYERTAITSLENKDVATSHGVYKDAYIQDSSQTFQADTNVNGDMASFVSGKASFLVNGFHIPMDVGLNASPGGEFGTPLPSLNHIKTINPKDTPLYFSSVDDVPRRHVWLEDSDDLSFYDMKPANNQKITFIPLTGDIMSQSSSTTPNKLEFNDGKYWSGPVNAFPEDMFTREGLVDSTIPYSEYVSDKTPDPYSINSLSSTPWSSEGSFNVGIVTTKTVITTSASTINFSCNQSLGVPQAVTVTGGSVSPQGLFGGVILSGPSGTSNASSQWGTGSDLISEMNTSVLYARVFDAWPEEQTMFDPRYFAVMHFNPGELGSIDGDNDLDIQEPTTINTQEFVADDVIVYLDSDIKPRGSWSFNTYRRGKLLPFNYLKSDIAVKDVHISDGGSNYRVGDTLEVSGGSGTGDVFEVTEVGPEPTREILSVVLIEGGTGYDVGDFLESTWTPDSGLKNLTLVDKERQFEGGQAEILLVSGIVFSSLEIDQAPKQHGATTRLSIPSRNGAGGQNGRAEGIIETPIALEGNTDNKYDVFLHFHNDTTYTLAEGLSFTPPVLQYLDLQITPGTS
jgi:hypothetical protein